MYISSLLPQSAAVHAEKQMNRESLLLKSAEEQVVVAIYLYCNRIDYLLWVYMKASLSASSISAEESEELDKSLKDAEEFAIFSMTSNASSSETIQNLSYSFGSNSTFQVTETLRANMAAVHYELAVLEAMGRFSDADVEVSSVDGKLPVPKPDISSCIFHLCEASMLGHCAATLALGKLRHGLQTELLKVFSRLHFCLLPFLYVF
jgi:hypothetical protein